MKKIGIIGASGQVGTEVCLFLKTYSAVTPIAIVRHRLSGALLTRARIEVRIGALGDPAATAALVGDCDVIADFSVPAAGEAAEVKAHYARNIPAAIAGSPPSARYVFISTVNAFGQGGAFNRAKYYLVPRSIYAHTKRFGERLTRSEGRRLRRETYIFRLGHVHGVLQRVSEETVELVDEPYQRFEYPATPSYTIFCHTIAEALVNVAAGKEKPGTYTAVSNPAWSWREVLEYHATPSREISVVLTVPPRFGLASAISAPIRGWIGALARRYKDTVNGNILHRFPAQEARLRADYYVKNARTQIQRWEDAQIYRPIGIHEGVFPGARLSSITDSRVTMPARAAQVWRMIAELHDGLGLGAEPPMEWRQGR